MAETPLPHPADDAAAAAEGAWLLRQDVAWHHLVRYGPPGFDVVLRVPLPGPDRPDRPDEPDPVAVAIGVLGAHTTTQDVGFAAVWEGWGGRGAPAAPAIDVPDRRMLLLTGPVASLPAATLTWEDPAGWFPPHLAWPRDHAWCVACDVDEEVGFGVACDEAAARAIEAALPGTRRVAYGAAEPMWRDG